MRDPVGAIVLFVGLACIAIAAISLMGLSAALWMA